MIKSMFLKIPRTPTFDWGESVAFHFLEIDEDGVVQRVIDIGPQAHIISRSPTDSDRYSAIDHPPLAEPTSWLEYAIPAAAFENLWNQ